MNVILNSKEKYLVGVFYLSDRPSIVEMSKDISWKEMGNLTGSIPQVSNSSFLQEKRTWFLEDQEDIWSDDHLQDALIT